MAMVKKSITVTGAQESWIQAQMATGNYATDSEIIREALRDKQARSAEIEYIRAALIEAENSGFSKLSKEEIRTSIKEELRANGKL